MYSTLKPAPGGPFPKDKGMAEPFTHSVFGRCAWASKKDANCLGDLSILRMYRVPIIVISEDLTTFNVYVITTPPLGREVLLSLFCQ